MWTFYLFVASISFLYGAENDYQSLGADLPIPLAEHITAIYGNYLYVFGGKRNSTAFNNKFWRLPLGSISLSGTDDITGFTGSWSEVSVTGPTYGPASTSGSYANQFACPGQCYATIGKYVYIVGSYTEESNDNTNQNNVYELDLSTLAFSAQGDFKSTTGYSSSTYGYCVTAIDDLLYTVGGAGPTDFIQYDPSSDTQTSLTAYSPTSTRFQSGCGGGTDDTQLWVLGAGVQPGPYTDDYTFSTSTWYIRSFNNNPSTYLNGRFDNTDSTTTASRGFMRCLSSLYDNFIECAGGFGGGSFKSTAVRFDTTAYAAGTSINTYSNLLNSVQSAGINSMSLLLDTTNYVAAELMIVTGGETSTGDSSDVVQYAVRYTSLPPPTKSPTPEPTDDPSTSPTMRPTQDPTCAGCTRNPSSDPTKGPTNNPTVPPVDTPGSGVTQLCVVLSCIMAFITVIII